MICFAFDSGDSGGVQHVKNAVRCLIGLVLSDFWSSRFGLLWLDACRMIVITAEFGARLGQDISTLSPL